MTKQTQRRCTNFGLALIVPFVLAACSRVAGTFPPGAATPSSPIGIVVFGKIELQRVHRTLRGTAGNLEIIKAARTVTDILTRRGEVTIPLEFGKDFYAVVPEGDYWFETLTFLGFIDFHTSLSTQIKNAIQARKFLSC